jgi:hypothetical protein
MVDACSSAAGLINRNMADAGYGLITAGQKKDEIQNSGSTKTFRAASREEDVCRCAKFIRD